MTSLETLWLVMGRELRARLATTTMRLMLVAAPLTVVVLVVVVNAATGGDATTWQVGLVGQRGAPIIEAASALAEQRSSQDPDRFETTEFGTELAAMQALERGDVEAVLIGSSRVIGRDEGSAFAEGSGLPGLLQEAAATVRVQELVASSEAAGEVLDVLGTDPLAQEFLNPADADDEARSIVAYVGLMLLYITILFNGTMVLTAVTEEKTNRVVEVLLAALRPWQLLAGKVIAVGLLGITQVGLTIAAGLIAVQVTNPVELPEVPVGSALMLVVWFVLGYGFYAVLLAAAGALVGRAEDAQSTVMPLNIVIVAGFLVSFAALADPTGPVAIIGTWVPITAPFTVPIRHALGEILVVELVGSMVAVIVSIILAIRLAGRIYGGALLRTGSRVRIREAWTGGSETTTFD